VFKNYLGLAKGSEMTVERESASASASASIPFFTFPLDDFGPGELGAEEVGG
jgi:hypothetical protein